jgi:hypothetical protein
VKLLCLPCSRLDLPGQLPVPLPAWSRPGPVSCANCGAVGAHRHQSIDLRPKEGAASVEGAGVLS